MFDGRKRHHARAVAGITAVLATMSLGLVMSPAAAAPDTSQKLDAAQARVDKLSDKAQTAEKRHKKAATKLSTTRKQLRLTSVEMRRHQRLIDALRAQVAATAVDDTYAGTAGSTAPVGTSSRALDAKVKKASTALLSNVVLVSQDAGAPADALARSNARCRRSSHLRPSCRGIPSHSASHSRYCHQLPFHQGRSRMPRSCRLLGA